MVRAASLGLALILALGSPATAQEAAPDPLAAFMAKYKDSIVASTELLYWVGLCEPYIDAGTVTFYLDEYAASGDGSTGDILNNGLSRVHLNSYIEGRKDRAKKPMDAPTCKRMVTSAAADLAAAQAKAGKPTGD